MEFLTEKKELIQQAIHILCTAKCYEEKAMMKAQMLGLQGEKRRLRMESCKNHQLINFLKCDSLDVYGFLFEDEAKEVDVPEFTTIKSFFEMYLKKIEDEHEILHGIANKLVACNGQHIACYLYDKCRCLVKEIKYYRRMILEGEKVSWNTEFIFLHQTTAENVHDAFEEKEKEIGYNF